MMIIQLIFIILLSIHLFARIYSISLLDDGSFGEPKALVLC